MSKRSSFKKIPKDFYPTIDPKALPTNFLNKIENSFYLEPCWGAGDLEKLIGENAACVLKGDLSSGKDGLSWTKKEVEGADLIITNPPYTKDVLLPLIDHWSSLLPTWLLLPSDMMHNKYFVPYMEKCSHVISVGRLYWFKNEWVVKEPFDYEELPKKWDSQVEFYDWTKCIKYYTGWLTNDGKPCSSETVRGTDNYSWYCFQNYVVDFTVFETRGD